MQQWVDLLLRIQWNSRSCLRLFHSTALENSHITTMYPCDYIAGWSDRIVTLGVLNMAENAVIQIACVSHWISYDWGSNRENTMSIVDYQDLTINRNYVGSSSSSSSVSNSSYHGGNATHLQNQNQYQNKIDVRSLACNEWLEVCIFLRFRLLSSSWLSSSFLLSVSRFSLFIVMSYLFLFTVVSRINSLQSNTTSWSRLH